LFERVGGIGALIQNVNNIDVRVQRSGRCLIERSAHIPAGLGQSLGITTAMRLMSGRDIQQARFDDFVARFNTDRPHQALGMKVPADLCARSGRVYHGLEELTFRFTTRPSPSLNAGASASKGAK